MDQRLLNVIEAIKKLEKDESKERLILFITSEYKIPTYMGDCGTKSIVYLESKSQLCCLYCDELYEYTKCKEKECGGLGIIEGEYGEEMEEDELAICLKCGEEIPKDVCSVSPAHTGYNFPEEYAGLNQFKEDHFEKFCPECYDDLYPYEKIYDYEDRD